MKKFELVSKYQPTGDQPQAIDALAQGITHEAAVSVIVGDFQRMDLYARLGYQLPQHIPQEAWEAFHALVEMGFDKQLAK